jgi:hypothetical protein
MAKQKYVSNPLFRPQVPSSDLKMGCGLKKLVIIRVHIKKPTISVDVFRVEKIPARISRQNSPRVTPVPRVTRNNLGRFIGSRRSGMTTIVVNNPTKETKFRLS